MATKEEEVQIKRLAAEEKKRFQPWLERLLEKKDKSTPYKDNSMFQRALWGGRELNLGTHRAGPPHHRI